MVTLKGNDIGVFVDEIYARSKKGAFTLAEMHGYKMYIRPFLGKESIRLLLLNKLKSIRNKKRNLELLRELRVYSDEELDMVANLAPDEIDNLLFEAQNYPDSKCHSTK